ncbi:ABC transporter permease [Euzebya tangerina]|uniref:ABC transporter permease n=1 Tax=Euzebya tangerina TaxID=591198 RepID=UPI000E31B096|nr:ABC transporter permease [Euzebya tangerina]
MLSDLTTLSVALCRRIIRTPEATLPNLAISVFFLFVYDGLLGGSDDVTRLAGGDYMTFILPLPILTAAVGGSLAGQLLVEDIQSGYFTRMLTSSINRSIIVIAPVLVAALAVLAQVAVVVGLGVALGVDPAAGVAGLAVILAISLLWGIGFAAYTVALGLITRNAAAVQSASFIFFPFLFMAPAFLPREQLRGWLEAVAAYNPVTYIIEGMRSLLISGWNGADIAAALAAAGALALVASTWAVRTAMTATSRP